MKALLMTIVAAGATSLIAWGADPAAPQLTVSREGDAIVVKSAEKQVVRYELNRPADSKLPVESGAYLHPVTTPGGIVVTDVAPADHLHHRGIFFAWVEMHGKKDADFWGWGEHAPTKGRRIINRGAGDSRLRGNIAGFNVANEWVADNETVLNELLLVAVLPEPSAKAHVLDMTYQVRPVADLTVSRWAFSGFCVRTRGDGKLTAYGPQGEVKLPNPSHVRPDSNWPDAPWYGYSLKFDNGTVAGVAVINHPENRKTLWHNHRDVRMLNPCIVAPSELKLKADQPLVLRYRVVIHDDETPIAELNRLAEKWRGPTR